MRWHRRIRIAAPACIALAAVWAQPAAAVGPGQSDAISRSTFGIAEVIEQIKREIRIAQEEGAEIGLLFRIDQVKLKMNLVSVASDQTGIGHEFAVGVTFGGRAAGTASESLKRTITLDMTPAEGLFVSGGESLGLAEAVGEVKEAVRTALKAEPEFALNCFTYAFDFQIDTTHNGKLTFIVVEAGRALQRQNSHNLSIMLSVDDQPPCSSPPSPEEGRSMMGICINWRSAAVAVAFLWVSHGAVGQPVPAADTASTEGPAPIEIELAKRAVVLIKTEHSIGTGFLISDKGHVLTALHVIQQRKDYIPHRVTLHVHPDFHPRSVNAYLVNANEHFDMAILQIQKFRDIRSRDPAKPDERMPYISLVEDRETSWKEVYYIGHPSGCTETNDCFVHQSQHPKSVDDEGYMLLTTQVESGFSGGPLLTQQGKAVGFMVMTGKWGGKAVLIHRARSILWSIGIDIYPEYRDYKADFASMEDQISVLEEMLVSLKEKLDWDVAVNSVPLKNQISLNVPGTTFVVEQSQVMTFLTIQYEKLFDKQITPVRLENASIEFRLAKPFPEVRDVNDPRQSPLFIADVEVQPFPQPPGQGDAPATGAFFIKLERYIGEAIDRYEDHDLGTFARDDIKEIAVAFEPVDAQQVRYKVVRRFATFDGSS